MASITVEIVSKTTSEAGTTFVLAASEEEIKRAGFVPYFIDWYFHGADSDVTADRLVVETPYGAVTPYGSVVLAPQVQQYSVGVLPFVPALTDVDINIDWMDRNLWISYKLVKTTEKPNGTYRLNPLTPDMNVGDTLVYYDSMPADPA